MIVLIAAAVRTWHLSNNGFGRPYYAAGVRSMLSCPHCFLFNSFDPAGFVSLDKPPIAIWIQVLGAKLLGFRGIAVLLPQVIDKLSPQGSLPQDTDVMSQAGGLLSSLLR